MILATDVVAYTNDGKAFNLSAFLEIQNIKRASDHGYWFDVKVTSFCNQAWRRVWAKEVPILRD
jgi:hypothetical protein